MHVYAAEAEHHRLRNPKTFACLKRAVIQPLAI